MFSDKSTCKSVAWARHADSKARVGGRTAVTGHRDRRSSAMWTPPHYAGDASGRDLKCWKTLGTGVRTEAQMPQDVAATSGVNRKDLVSYLLRFEGPNTSHQQSPASLQGSHHLKRVPMFLCLQGPRLLLPKTLMVAKSSTNAARDEDPTKSLPTPIAANATATVSGLAPQAFRTVLLAARQLLLCQPESVSDDHRD